MMALLSRRRALACGRGLCGWLGYRLTARCALRIVILVCVSQREHGLGRVSAHVADRGPQRLWTRLLWHHRGNRFQHLARVGVVDLGTKNQISLVVRHQQLHEHKSVLVQRPFDAVDHFAQVRKARTEVRVLGTLDRIAHLAHRSA
jgi:hypothetical protein